MQKYKQEIYIKHNIISTLALPARTKNDKT